jgi:trans-aconitate methyltransferase
MDARSLNINNRFDLVFSNAAMHRVDEHSLFFVAWRSIFVSGGRPVLSCGGAGNASGIIAALEMVTSSSAWQRYFDGFHFHYHFYSPDDYSACLPEANLTAVRCEPVEKDMIHDRPEGLAGWIRTTWLPYRGISTPLGSSWWSKFRFPARVRATFDPALRQARVKPFDSTW